MGELKLGYSFGPPLQLYLSASLDNSTLSGSTTFRNTTVAVNVQYHLVSRRNVGVYARGAIGAGFSSSLTSSTQAGLSFGGGLGVEFRVAPDLFLAPELFYRQVNLSGGNVDSLSVSCVGLSLGVIYY